MPTKGPATVNREQLIKGIHTALRAYIEAGKGKLLVIGPMQIVPRKGMEFDVVIRCIGTRPKLE